MRFDLYLMLSMSNKTCNFVIQEAQLPQRNSASAAHMKGAGRLGPPAGGQGPPAHPSAPSGYTYAYGRIRKPQRTYVKHAVRKAHFNMNRAFKVIQGHPYWCRHESRTVCCRNVQCELKLTATGKRQIRRFQRPHAGLKTSQQETPLNIYKWFTLPETRVIGLHFCR